MGRHTPSSEDLSKLLEDRASCYATIINIMAEDCPQTTMRGAKQHFSAAVGVLASLIVL